MTHFQIAISVTNARHCYCLRRHPDKRNGRKEFDSWYKRMRRGNRRKKKVEEEEGRSGRISSVALAVPQGAWYVIFESQSVETACYFS